MLVLALVFASGPAHAYLLDEHFGVTLELDADGRRQDARQGDAWSYPMLLSSYNPTLNLDTTRHVVNDWFGSWSATSLAGVTDWNSGQRPSGSEPYDVEALYLDYDASNLYVAVVTSFPEPAGLVEARYHDTLVVTGDLAIDVGLNAWHSDTDRFRYDYGVNINNEVRAGSGDATAGSPAVLGDHVYRTANDDWFVGTPSGAVAAAGEHSNFDPDWSSFSGSYQGDAGVAYYDYSFSGGLQECLFPTRVIEATIPLSALGNLDPETTSIGLRFLMGCRNDGNSTDAALTLHTPEPGSLMLMGLGLAAMGVGARRRRRPARRRRRTIQ